MSLRNSELVYGSGARFAHWVTVLLLTGSFGLGWVMTELAVSPLRLKLFSYHKWIGVSIFGLAILRLLWRFYSRPPALPGHMADWERRVAHLTHVLLYVLLFAAALSGWLMSSAKGFQTVYFGVLPIPDLLAKNPPLGEFLEEIHVALTWLLLSVAGLHAAAALKHHFIDRDDVLARMTPGLRVLPPGAP